MVDAEKVKAGLQICSDTKKFALGCNECPYLNGVLCVSILASDAAELIALLEERIGIMQKSIVTLEKRNEPVSPIVSQDIFGTYFVCGNCGEKLEGMSEERIEMLKKALALYEFAVGQRNEYNEQNEFFYMVEELSKIVGADLHS